MGGRHRLVMVQAFTARERAEANQLAERCKQYEALDLELNLETTRLAPGDILEHFLFYDHEDLIGLLSLPPGPDVEICVMVHPRHRRKGIGRAVLAAARAACRREGIPSLLLVSEQASASGKAFAEAVGARYCDSEHRMEWDPTASRRAAPNGDGFQLRPAGADRADMLTRLTAAAFGDPEEEVKPRIEGWLKRPEHRFFIGMWGDEPVGSLRVFTAPGKSCLYLCTFGVLPKYWGRGHGRQILTATVDLLRTEGWQQIRIEAATENRNALSLYRSCGFRDITAYDFYEIQA